MDKRNILKGFNNHFEDFLEDISIIFPTNNDIQTSKTALLLLRKANPKKIINIWYRFVYLKYNDEINKENIDFFLTKDYSDDIKNIDSGSSKVLDAIDKVRQPLKDLNIENKNKCIQYLKNLNSLSNIYIN
jgi:hypothetical protein